MVVTYLKNSIMKIEVVGRRVRRKKKDFVKIAFDPKIAESFFVKRNGEEILMIKSPEKKEINRRKYILLARKIVAEAKRYRLKKINIDFADLYFPKVTGKPKNFQNLWQKILRWRIMNS